MKILLNRYVKSGNTTTFTYNDIYDKVMRNNETQGKLSKIKKMAQLIYSRGYGTELNPSKNDAVYIALELYEEMTGTYYDPTLDEFDDIVDSIIG